MVHKITRIMLAVTAVILLGSLTASQAFAGGFQIPATAAIVSTGAAASVTQTSANLSATTTDPGSVIPAERGFNYGSTNQYGSHVSETGSFNTGYQFVSKFGTYGFDSFSPQYVAHDADGNIYVGSNNNGVISVFAPDGTLVRQFGGVGTNNGQFDGNLKGLAVDGSDIYAVDSTQNRVEKLSLTGDYETQFGGSNAPDGEKLTGPTGVAVDAQHNVYVVDTGNYRVVEYSSSGTFIKMFGFGVSDGASNLQVCTSNCQVGIPGGNLGQFNDPVGITVDPSGNIYVTDVLSSDVLKFDSNDSYVGTFGNIQMDRPWDITQDSNGNFYVTDSSQNAVNIFNSSGIFAATIGSLGSSSGQFNQPLSTTVDSVGNIYVSDPGNARVEKFNPAGTYISEINLKNTAHLTDGFLNNPSDIALDASGNRYVADSSNDRIEEFDSTGAFVKTIGSYGTGNGQMMQPVGIAINADGTIYVADSGNNRIDVFDNTGTYQTVFGEMGSGDGQLNTPYGIALDGTGDVYVADPGNNRIDIFSPVGTFIKAIGWGVSDGDPSLEVCTSNCQAGINGSGAGQLDNPLGIAVDQFGTMYVVDTNNSRVEKFDAAGNFISGWGSSGAGNGQFDNPPGGIAIDSKGNIYVSNNSKKGARIQKFDSSGNYITKWGVDGRLDGQMEPFGVTVDSAGIVYVVDQGGGRVETYSDVSGKYILPVTGLACGTQYHYSAYVTSGSGTGNGDDQVFTTQSCNQQQSAPVSQSQIVGSGYAYVCTDPKALNYHSYTTSGNTSCRYSSDTTAVTDTTNPTSATVIPGINQTLRFGDRNANVKLIQQYLNNHGYQVAVHGVGSVGHENNYFGILTKKSVQKFERDHGITADGVVGPKVRALMK